MSKDFNSGCTVVGLRKVHSSEKFLTRRVGNSVENRESTLANDLFAGALALCTGAGAGA